MGYLAARFPELTPLLAASALATFDSFYSVLKNAVLADICA